MNINKLVIPKTHILVSLNLYDTCILVDLIDCKVAPLILDCYL